MTSRSAGILAGLLLLISICAAPAAQAANKRVNVRVEGLHHTLLDETLASLSHGPVAPDGNPADSCPAGSALGALNAATGDYDASWSSDFSSYLINGIRGETHTYTSDGRFWSFWVDDKMASVGLCDYKVKKGDRILLFPACAKAGCTSATPLELRAPRAARAGHRVKVRVVYHSADGKAHRAAGAVVRGAGARAKTNRRGVAALRLRRAGNYEIRAAARGHIRSEALPLRVRGR